MCCLPTLCLISIFQTARSLQIAHDTGNAQIVQVKSHWFKHACCSGSVYCISCACEGIKEGFDAWGFMDRNVKYDKNDVNHCIFYLEWGLCYSLEDDYDEICRSLAKLDSFLVSWLALLH